MTLKGQGGGIEYLVPRPHKCTCKDDLVYVGYVVESKHDLDGEVVEYRRVPCRRCLEGGRF